MDSLNVNKTCCFFGHRKINETDKIKRKLYKVIEDLIVNKNVDTFLFGSKSQFDALCLNFITDFKERYSYIKRIYVRAEYRYIDDSYENYLLNYYDYTYYPERIANSGKASYVERNQEMINNSTYCVIYYNEHYIPLRGKSGTKIAYDYARKKDKNIILI